MLPELEDPVLLDLAGRVADGEKIDWSVELGASAADLHDLLLALRAIEGLATVEMPEAEPSTVGDTAELERWGHLELLGVLGRGSFGSVYVARDPLLDRLVALKLYSADARASESRQALLREGRLLARLRHENVATVYGVDERDGRLGLWMELIRGQTLAQRLVESGPMGAMEAALAGIELCRALAAVHATGIIHRDVKAQNVIREEGGRLVLVDFGLGLEDARAATSTPSGTPLYLAPEVLTGGAPSVASDLYAVGVLLYFLVTGRHPVEAASVGELVAAHREGRSRSLRDERPGLPEAFVRLLDRALAPDPRARYPSAGVMEEALLSLVGPRRQPRGGGHRVGRLAIVGTGIVAALMASWAVAVFSRGDADDELPPTGRLAPRRVTAGPGWEREPAISPDGTLVAFASVVDRSTGLWLVDVRGGEPIPLVVGEGDAGWPSWFPDGSAIAFESNRTGRNAVWKVNRLGGSATVLVDDASQPAVSPDGRRLAFSRVGPDGLARIWIAELDQPGQARPLTPEGVGYSGQHEASWSPDGSLVAFRDFGDLWVAAADGRAEPKALTADDAGVSGVCFSPAGRWLYFGSSRAGTQAIWRVRVGGGSLQRVTLGSSSESHPRISQDGSRLTYSTYREQTDIAVADLSTGAVERIRGAAAELFPTFSPDGRFLAFVTTRNGLAQLWLTRLVNGHLDGDPWALVVGGGAVSNPSISPDGRWVAYQRREGERRDLYVAPMAGGQERLLLDTGEAELMPAWSPDGRQLAFVSEAEGRFTLWSLPMRGGSADGDPRLLLRPDVWVAAPVWSPDSRHIALVTAGATDESNAISILDTRDRTTVRLLEADTRLVRMRWPAADRLLVSAAGRGEELALRPVLLTDGKLGQALPGLHLGASVLGGQFDVTTDGTKIAYSYGDVEGDAWVVEGPVGAF